MGSIIVKKLELDKLRPGMWVWNDTKKCYQQLRYVILSDGNYHWADGKNECVEGDTLYRFVV